MHLSIPELEKKAAKIRLRSIEMIETAGGGHIGGSLSAMDIMTALYFRIMNVDPDQPKDPNRDWFILSAGHKAAGFVPVLSERGYFGDELLDTFNKLGSPFGMHPDKNKIVGCEVSTGSLGHGLPMAIGIALSLRLDKLDSTVYCLMGDGENHEGTVWEAAMGAAQHRLGNLVAIIDYNKCSMDGPIDTIVSLEPIVDKWKAFGWHVIRIDGNDMVQVVAAFEQERPAGKPCMIIADTLKGKGVPSIEGDYHWHYGVLNEKQLEQARRELGGKCNG
jgi:transketolase